MRQIYILFIVLILVPFFGISQTFTTIAVDNAGNYTSGSSPFFGLNINDNGGSGFNAWTWSDSGSSRSAFTGWGPNDDHGNIGNPSFGLFADGSSSINAFRSFQQPLQNGDILTVEFTINFRAGQKGVEIYQNGTGIFLFQSTSTGEDKYEYRDPSNSFTDTGWAYQANSIFRLTVEQVSADTVNITVERTNSTGDSFTLSNENVNGRINEVRFFNQFAGGGEQNFYFNNLLVQRPTFTTIADGNVNNSATWANDDVPDGTGRVVINHEVTIAENEHLVASDLEWGIDGNLILNSISDNYSSLIVDNVIGSGTVTYNRYTAQIAPTGTNDLIASPVSGQQFGAFATANDGVLSASGDIRAFAPFNTVTGNYENYDIVTNANTTITPGVGYRAATDSGQILAFTGTPNNGAVAVSLQDNTSFWNLIGNPYPSYIDIGDFLAENVATTNIDASFYGVYGYDGDVTNGWTVWDLNVNQDLLIAPGQGFFVAAPSGGGSGIDFTTAMRRIGTSDDFIAGRNITSDVNFAHAILNLNTASASYVTNVYFRDINTLGLDPGYDTGAFDQNANGIFTQLVENNNGVNLVNQSLPYNDLNEVTVPLNVNMSQVQTLDFSLDSNTILPPAINVYLEDTVAGSFTLLNNNSYTVTPESALNGTGRFFLRFTSGTLSIGDELPNSLNMYQDTSAQVLVIEGQLQENTAAYIYDLQGRLVQSTWLEAGQLQRNLKVSSLQTGIYIVKIGQQITHKVMIR